MQNPHDITYIFLKDDHFLSIYATVTSGAKFPFLSCLQELLVDLTHAHFVATLAVAGISNHLERVRENIPPAKIELTLCGFVGKFERKPPFNLILEPLLQFCGQLKYDVPRVRGIAYFSSHRACSSPRILRAITLSLLAGALY